jgi:hypothetical protein
MGVYQPIALEVEVEQPAQVLDHELQVPLPVRQPRRCPLGASEKDRSSAKYSRPMVLGCPAESSR